MTQLTRFKIRIKCFSESWYKVQYALIQYNMHHPFPRPLVTRAETIPPYWAEGKENTLSITGKCNTEHAEYRQLLNIVTRLTWVIQSTRGLNVYGVIWHWFTFSVKDSNELSVKTNSKPEGACAKKKNPCHIASIIRNAHIIQRNHNEDLAETEGLWSV